MDNISLRTKISCIPPENKGFGTVFRLILSEKKSFSMKTTHQLSISEVKRCLVTGNISKAYKVRNLFLSLDDRRKSRHFFQPWSLAHGQNSRMLIMFFRSEYTPHELPLQTSSSPKPGCQYAPLQRCKLY